LNKKIVLKTFSNKEYNAGKNLDLIFVEEKISLYFQHFLWFPTKYYSLWKKSQFLTNNYQQIFKGTPCCLSWIWIYINASGKVKYNNYIYAFLPWPKHHLPYSPHFHPKYQFTPRSKPPISPNTPTALFT